MDRKRILIEEIGAWSKTRPVAYVKLTDGLNVITGASDTGKTYLFQCLEFMLGAKKAPKKIPEGAQYELAYITVLSEKGRFTLMRPLEGGHFKFIEGNFDLEKPSTKLSNQHSSDDSQNYSMFYLSMLGIGEVGIRKNASGETRTLSFSDLRHLASVSEIDMFTEKSPFLTGQVVSKTAEQSVMKYFLEGKDSIDVSMFAPTRRSSGNVQFVRIVEGFKSEAEELFGGKDESASGLVERRQKLETTLGEIRAQIGGAASTIDELLKSRSDLLSLQRTARNRQIVVSQLLKRFELLTAVYAVDIGRLNSMKEGLYLLEMHGKGTCPWCGSAITKDHVHLGEENLEKAANAEFAKIEKNVAELNITIDGLKAEAGQLDNTLKSLDKNLSATAQDLQRISETQFNSLRAYEVRIQDELLTVDTRLNVITQTQLLEKLVQDENEYKISPAAISTPLLTSDMSVLCEVFGQYLAEIGFQNGRNVQYSESNLDFVLNGKDRASYGKGIRAITHATFNVSLMEHVKQQNRPHPGFVILDSPVVTYKEPDVAPGEGISDDMKDNFYRVLAALPKGSQVIVIENDDPPDDIKSSINYVHFSGKQGTQRFGFFPV